MPRKTKSPQPRNKFLKVRITPAHLELLAAIRKKQGGKFSDADIVAHGIEKTARELNLQVSFSKDKGMEDISNCAFIPHERECAYPRCRKGENGSRAIFVTKTNQHVYCCNSHRVQHSRLSKNG